MRMNLNLKEGMAVGETKEFENAGVTHKEEMLEPPLIGSHSVADSPDFNEAYFY